MDIPSQGHPLVLPGGLADPIWYEFLAGREAYKTYVPTLSAVSGAFTTASATGRYRKVGRTVFLNIVVPITDAGTAAAGVRVTLPFTSGPAVQIVHGRETQTTGVALHGTISASGALMEILRYDNLTAAASARTLVMTGTYEAAN